MAYWDKFQTKGIPFMENRDKGDIKSLIGKPVHITDYGFIKNDEGDYAAFIIAEDTENFYFGNAILTEMLHQVDADGMRDELRHQGIKFSMATSKKSGREYMRFEFTGDIPF